MVFGTGTGGAAGYVRRPCGRSATATQARSGFDPARRPTASRVANGSLDLACVRLAPTGILERARRPLFVEDLYDDPLVLAAAPGVDGFDEFLNLNEKSFTPKALTRFPLVLPEPDAGLRREFDRRCRDAGVADRLRVAIEVGPAPTALGYVRDALGVGVLPRSAVNGQKDLVVKTLPSKLSPTNTIRVICRKRAGTDDLDLTDRGVDFLQALRDAAAT